MSARPLTKGDAHRAHLRQLRSKQQATHRAVRAFRSRQPAARAPHDPGRFRALRLRPSRRRPQQQQQKQQQPMQQQQRRPRAVRRRARRDRQVARERGCLNPFDADDGHVRRYVHRRQAHSLVSA